MKSQTNKFYKVSNLSGISLKAGPELVDAIHAGTIPKDSLIKISEERDVILRRLKLADGRGWTSLVHADGGMPCLAIVRNKVYSVVYPTGAPVRTGLDLSSPVVTILPPGAVVEVSEEAHNNQNIRRLRLADGSGWTSLVDTDGQSVLIEISTSGSSFSVVEPRNSQVKAQSIYSTNGCSGKGVQYSEFGRRTHSKAYTGQWTSDIFDCLE